MATPFAIAANNALSSRSINLPGGQLLRLDALPETDEECTAAMVRSMAARITDLQKELAEPIWKPGQARPSWNASPERRDHEYEEKVGWNEPPVIEQKQRLMQARILKAWMK